MAKYKDKKLRAQHIRTSLIRFDTIISSDRVNADGLSGLTASIERYGIVQPLILTREPLELRYTLVAGRRRLAAAKRLELEFVPALIVPAGQAPQITLLENLHRRQPSCFETARLLEQALAVSGLDETTFGAGYGLSEAEIQEKRHLLKFDETEAALCTAARIDQETANKILAMPKSERDRLFFGLLNPARDLSDRAWQLRDRLGLGNGDGPHRAVGIKDVRIFFNTIDRALDVMKQAGIGATFDRHDYDGLIEYIIRIPSVTAEPPRTQFAAACDT